MANWDVFNQGLGSIAEALANEARQKKSQEDSLQMMLMKATIEQKMKEQAMQGNLQRNLQMLEQMGFGLPQNQRSDVIDTTGQIVPVQKDEYMTQVEPRLDAEGGLSLGFKRELRPEAQTRRKIEEQRQLESIKGLPMETGGKLAMVKQAKKDIQEARQMLFPDGTPKSFSRSRAFVSNLPGSRAPLFGAIIPQSMPFNEMGQKIYSRLQNAVAAKLRVETGAQANPSEVENILARFGVTSASDAKAAWDALQRLENFMDETTNITDPTGRFSSGISKNDGQTSSGIKYKIAR